MKSKYSLWVSILLMIICIVFASCNESADEVTTAPEETTTIETVEEAKDVVIASDGEDLFTIIRYIDASEDELDLILDFKNDLNSTYKMFFAISSDWTMPSNAPAADAPEIIIGLTQREATAKVIREFNMGYGDCAVQLCENNKIVIVAPNYKDLTIGFDYFLRNLSVTTDEASGIEQVVYTGGNFFYESATDNLWDDPSVIAEYQIVYDKDGKYKKQAETLAKSFKKHYDLELNVVSENEPQKEREIVVGLLSDASRFEYDYSSVNGIGYVIASSDKSFLICGANDAGVSNAVNKFINIFLKSGNLCTMNLAVNTVLNFSNFSGGESTKLADGADTRIMSFNILSEEWDAKAVMEGRDIRVSAVILNYHPDVAALQEVSNAWYPVLENYIGDVYDFTRKKIPSGSGTYTTLIYNTETTKLIEEGIHIFSVGNSKRLRSVVWGVFESIATKERYVVFSTHWDVGAEKQSQRIIQATEMAELANEFYQKYKVDIFACGDFNASDTTTEYKTFLEKAGFVDAKKNAKVINRACKTYHTLFQDVSTGTYESIDHITFMEQTAPKVLYYNTLIAQYVIDGSDHCPIYIDIKLAK